jgi:hypothetical protein
MQSSGIADGEYRAEFLSVEPTSSRFGDSLLWKFRIAEGPHAGTVVGRATGEHPTPSNSCGEMLRGLVGRELEVDEEIDAADYAGRCYRIRVESQVCSDGKSRPRVARILRAD